MIDARREPSLVECHATPRERAVHFRLAAVCLAWAVAFVGARYLLRHVLAPEGAIAWLVAAVPSVAGVALMVAYTRYLRDIDELQRAIQLRAMAYGFGGGFLAICGYVTFEALGAPAVDSTSLIAVMPILYSVAMVTSAGRYR